MNRTTCPYGMVDTCCENYNDCSLKDEAKINAELRAEIERLKQREWVGLTDDEIEHIADSEWEEAFVRMIEAKLREKNHG